MVTLWLLATIKKYLQFLKQFPTIKSPVYTRIPKITIKYIEIIEIWLPSIQISTFYPVEKLDKKQVKKGQEIGQNGDFWPT